VKWIGREEVEKIERSRAEGEGEREGRNRKEMRSFFFLLFL